MSRQRYKAAKRTLLILLAAIVSIAIFFLVFSESGNSALQGVYELFGVSSADYRDDYISFLDVGQGDSVLVSSNGYYAVIDTGPPESKDKLLSELNKARLDDIDVLLISHLHKDHTGGLPTLCENYSVDNLIVPSVVGDDSDSDTDIAKKNVLSDNGKVYTAKRGINFQIGDFEITIVGYYPEMENENNRSVIAMAKIGEYKFLLTGDAQAKTENKLLRDGINIDCDVLKVGHHGSKTSTCKDFLKSASPEFSIISVGEGNMYNHPSQSTVKELEKVSKVLRTDESGTVTFYIENNELNYEF